MKDYFFQTTAYIKKKGFDSYSKTTDDIFKFYQEKYPELSESYKRNRILSTDQLAKIRDHIHDDEVRNMVGNHSFESYIAAFIHAMSEDYGPAEYYFNNSIALLDNSFASKVNHVFILLQLAQLYERQEKITLAFKTLKAVYVHIYTDPDLIEAINNFYASCCTSIGLLLYRWQKMPCLAGMMFFKAVKLRLNYRDKYPSMILENYLSTVYRYFSECYLLKKSDKYITLKIAYAMRLELVTNTSDEFTKSEFLHLCSDFLLFLINHKYPSKYINKIQRSVWKIVASLDHSTALQNCRKIARTALMLAKYYYIEDQFDTFFRWYALAKNTKRKYQLPLEEHFLQSEEIYELIKA
ncbi:hypothetical protein KHS38_15020 [Mucilaginibacter sp. Bleaf8]|uniref:hypothetical protein n=1 Tax=Mucilaginibacter sp. Bleaf8 TaxID=2834430 RepID=UPI001BCFF38D|nr:hypothetical protein [Mucilaginibacter sp. Bleaf8]MBS7565722.1 hypothetical protein [Mucilaginibacter sp. Bleaf8]